MLRLLPKIKCITKREQYGTERKCNVRALTGICEFHQSYFKRLWLQTEGQDVCTFWLIVWNVNKSTCDRLKSKWVQNRELKQRQRQLEWQKSNRFIVAKQQLCTCIMLFCTFLCCHCMTTAWKCLISRFVKDRNTRQQLSFSFPELWYSPLEFNSKKIANIWQN